MTSGDLPPPADEVLGGFSGPTRTWFAAAFAAPTPAQLGAWESIRGGQHTLVVAPTGSGKTLAAFLSVLDRLAQRGPPAEKLRRCRVVYVSPLKALAVDVERNLRSPLTGIREAARRLGVRPPDITVALRSGDTPQTDRRRFMSRPSDILITTPESLFLLLTSQAREALRGVDTVIVDEIHAVAGTKRGAHLALSLERLDALLQEPAQRIGLSATVRPTQEVARFLGGQQPVRIVAPAAPNTISLQVVVPVEDMAEIGRVPDSDAVPEGAATADPQRASIWPHLEQRIVDLVQAHRSTIVFANSRRLAERLTARLNEIAFERAEGKPLAEDHSPAQVMAESGAARGAPALIARAHHGSVSKEQRGLIEEDLKAGRLPCVVATSSLELGIDMGAVDLVIQVEPPPSVASGLQRVGRSGHQVGAISRGVVFPKHRSDLVPTVVSVERMHHGLIEALSIPQNPLDVLAQQIVAMVAVDPFPVEDLFTLVRRAAPFATLPRSAFDATLDLLSGRYPSDEFAELRPRIVWDRVTGALTARPGAQRLAVTSGGTIPDRGLFGVFLVGSDAGSGGARSGGARVGELDEEMVYESRVGDVFALGTTSWRIEDITHDRVLVSPAPGQPGRLPFWKGDALGRPAELGAAIGGFVRELARLDAAAATERVRNAGLDEWAAANLVAYLAEQREATGHLPHDRSLVVERFRDELGDWRIVVHSPFGAQVHAPWALAIGARVRERYGIDSQAVSADDGIVLRIPDTEQEPPGADVLILGADEVEEIVTAEVGGSALFASRFRECAARALLLPRRDPGKRSPLWQQRQRSASLLGVASRYGSFPIVLETVRECLQDVYDVPALVQVMRDIASRKVRVVELETQQPSPFARSLLMGYVEQFLYEGDSPLAERRAAALALDQSLLAELLGRTELRDLLNPEVIERTEAELQWLVDERRAKDTEGIADMLRLLGPLTTDQVVARSRPETAVAVGLAELEAARRAVRVRVAGVERWIGVEDVGRLRDGLGIPVPVGVPAAFTEPVSDPLGDLLGRYARTHGPFATGDVADVFGLGTVVVDEALRRLSTQGRVNSGEFRPGGHGPEWCDMEVLRRIRRRSLAALRHEVEPVEPATLGRFLPVWQHVGGRLRGVDGTLTVIEQLAGCPVPGSALESLVLGSRVIDYSPAWLDQLTTSGEVVWAGSGPLPGTDGWVSLHLAESAPLTLPDLDSEAAASPLHQAILEALGGGGAYFFRQLSDLVRAQDDRATTAALWDLVWAGYLSNDTLLPLRTMLSAGRTTHRNRRTAPRSHLHRPRPGARRADMPSRAGPPTAAGRWSLLPERATDPTRRAHAFAEALLDRHGVVTRGAATSERIPGGFAAVYKVLSAFEGAGRCRRGYFVAGLGAAQFGAPGAVDRLRGFTAVGQERTDFRAVALAATDPANPFGAALAWPDRTAQPGAPAASGHRPGRKAGALVVLVDGDLVLYVERGGRTLLTFSDEPERVQPAVDALALAVRDGALGRLTVERADGAQILGSALGAALESAGFHATPRGLRLRA